MKFFRYFDSKRNLIVQVLAVVCVAGAGPVFATQAELAAPCEPLLETGWAADLSRVTEPGFLQGRLELSRARLRSDVKRITSLPIELRHFENTSRALETAFENFSRGISRLLAVAGTVFPESRREEIEKIRNEVSEEYSAVYLNRDLYLAVEGQHPRDEVESRMLEMQIHSFKLSGASLPDEARARLQQLELREAQLTSSILNNLKGSVLLELNAAELKGLNAETLASLPRTKAGHVQVQVSSSKLIHKLLSEVHDERVRREVFLAYRGRAPANGALFSEWMDVLTEVAKLKSEPNLLNLLISPESVAGDAKEVFRILDDVRAAIKPSLLAKATAMQAAKNLDHPGAALRPWDAFYYENRMASEQADSTAELARLGKSFPVEGTMERALRVFARVIGVEVQERSVHGWHPTVRAFEVTSRAGERLGWMLIDPFSREEKDPNTAFVTALSAPGPHQSAAVAVVFNMGDVATAKTRNLTLTEVGTLVHEFGHAFHAMFANAESPSMWGYGRTQDFMEIPSNLGELLLTDERLLTEISGAGGVPKLTAEQAQMATRSLLSTPRVSPTHLHHTIFLAWLDLLIFNRETQNAHLTPAQIHQLYAKAYREFYGYDTDPADHFVETFSHLAVGYAGNYYSYFSSKMAAINIWDRIEAMGGVHNPSAVGAMTLDIFAPSQISRSKATLEKYLGGPVSAEPYLRRLGLTAPNP